MMHVLILETILDGDQCNKLEQIEYSPNPRQIVTIQDMLIRHFEITRLEQRVKDVMGA